MKVSISTMYDLQQSAEYKRNRAEKASSQEARDMWIKDAEKVENKIVEYISIANSLPDVIDLDLIKQKVEEHRKLEIEIETASQNMAENSCPFKIGEVVENCGCSFYGKKLRITHIGYVLSNDWYTGEVVHEWVVNGVVLKANGDDSRHLTSFSQIQYERTT